LPIRHQNRNVESDRLKFTGEPRIVHQEASNKINELLAAVERKEDGALDNLVAAIYPELKQLAHFQLMKERPGHTLNTTAIVHEVFERLASGDGKWLDRAHFLRAASTVMRHLLVDHARKRTADKRGGGIAPLTLEDHRYADDDDSMAVLALDDALKDMAEIDPRLVQLIECRYFAGLSMADTAEVLDISLRTAERDWRRARAYLRKAMDVDVN
jgi:RNA polymerase sigma factor (TIGR02999 family)